MAGVIEIEFQPYIKHYLPPLLERIAMAIQIEVAEEGDCFASKIPQNPSGVPQNQNQKQNQNQNQNQTDRCNRIGQR